MRRQRVCFFQPFWSVIGYGLCTLVLNWVCFLEELATYIPTQFFWKYPPGTFLSLWIRNGGSLCQAFLADTVETGTKNRCVMEATNVLRRQLRKIKFRAFRKRVGPRTLSLESVDYLEQVNTTEWSEKNKNLN